MCRSLWRNLGSWVMFLALGVSLAAIGCGGATTATVSGTVSYKGSPLKGGSVLFIPADKNTLMSEIGEDGKYTIANVPVGPAQIAVQTSSLKPTGSRRAYSAPKDAPPGYRPPDLNETTRRYVEIPQKYEDPAKSGLSYTVTSGSQQHDIKLD